MLLKRKSILLVVAVVVIIAMGAFVVSAQDTTTPTQPGFGRMGHGMMGGARFMWDDDNPPMFTALAEALGIDATTLATELQSGKTLAQLAEENGVDLTAVTAAAQTAMQQHLDELVTAGVLTQAQADARLSVMQEHWAEMPLFDCAGCGLMMGGGRGGMWDNNQAMRRGGMGRGR